MIAALPTEEEMGNEEHNISVSRETLRNEVRLANAELELSLRKWIGDELEKKASTDVVAGVVATVAQLQHEILTDEERRMVRAFGRGEFSRAQSAAVEDMIDEKFVERADAGWSKRERLIAVAGLIFWICSVALSALALSGVKG
jgi:hypothetical protein